MFNWLLSDWRWVWPAAVAFLILVVGFLVDGFLVEAQWWPLVGYAWREEREARAYEKAQAYLDSADELDGLAPETWVEDLPPERPLVLVHEPVYTELSDDPDLIVWDAKQQAQRCWEIVHIEFPRLRAELAREYQAAA